MLIELTYDSKVVKEPILTKIAIEEKALMNIIEAKVGAREGRIVVELDDSIAERIAKRFTDFGVRVRRIEKGIEKGDNCVDCGACVSVCPAEVFYFDEDYRVITDSARCVRCGSCIEVCPVKALKLPE